MFWVTNARHFIEQRQQSGVKCSAPLYTPDVQMQVVETELVNWRT